MRIDEEEVRRIADLARLELREDQVSSMVEHFRRLGEHFEALRSVDLNGLECLVDDEPPGRMREDQVRRWRDSELVLLGAPRREGHFFKVPRIGVKE
ncbi:glutamyl-tRNA(Gln) and/or aspartyl-tRNA(Asn) amidotransferase, C subunit [Thermanaerovibrio velox DSM 12556]|uniref:Aspartyl/glutamyl-tRNA(Asn/Gln) amidotransferase subunit C n=1 Tax=Thermanaerovibrio velox DSM 12556 TaxID=926567 RepID=H0UQY0_9BACT|nr:Asp-tRNA(Asn)/Glu-tRNA(Gln) amidotransferase subunit GatC [Thermanaerovibrio velox]EHM09809.1 glutamyl-tRNA(Gln) and/or aspartyl-tRNA(Asn) amidotransferase, C subunit [Thermanaerovibrio velox DSM 12556]